jgi:sterol 3beta-glucosyltransferase
LRGKIDPGETMKKPVVLLTTGTRGDLQPILALARALHEDGVPTRVATDSAFHPWVSQYDLPFTPVDGNPSMVLARPGYQSALTYDGNLLRSLAESQRYLQAARPVYNQMLHSAWEACQGAGALVVSLPTLWGAYIAKALGIPYLFALLQPLSRTAAFQCSLFPVSLPDWAPLNRISYFLVEQAIWLPWRRLLNQWLRSELHLPPAPFTGPASRLYEKGVFVLHAISPSIVPRPKDWPTNHRLTGFWTLDPAPAWQPPADLVDFLAAGPAPLYFGFGSGGLHRQQAAVEAILQALDHTSSRAVIQLPPELFPHSLDTRRVTFSDNIPHTWLFPYCAGAVHHGGAGTTAAALRAGIPSLIVPQASDQFFWARRVQSLGAGPVPIPQYALDGSKLTAGLRWLSDDLNLTENARRLAAAIQREGGARETAAFIENHLLG